METCLSYTDTGIMYFSSTERKWQNKIRKLAEEHPDEVQILAQPEDNDGCIYATMPTFYLKIAPKRAVNMTDEEKLIRAEQMRKLVQKQRELSASRT